ncbi:MAG: hypothetical protein R3267_05595 [Paenisporosarcina sp.]|nr:hypothetical protein [Paenisporosarcina sp.]
MILLLIELLAIHMGFFMISLFDLAVAMQQMFSFTYKEYVEPVQTTQTSDLPLWGMPSDNVITLIQETVASTPVYEASELTEAHHSFIANLLVDDCTPPQAPWSQLNVEEDTNMLTMEEWHTEPAPVSVTKQLAATASAKISELMLGEQLWVVEVVGEEQGYAHVSDGSARAWVDLSALCSVRNGDILSVLIDRSSDLRIRAIDVDILQRRSTEFALLEDIDWTENLEERELITA